MRLYELAKKYDIDKKRLLDGLIANGFSIKNSLASVDDAMVAWTEEQSGKGFPALPESAAAKPKKKAKTKTKKKVTAKKTAASSEETKKEEAPAVKEEAPAVKEEAAPVAEKVEPKPEAKPAAPVKPAKAEEQPVEKKPKKAAAKADKKKESKTAASSSKKEKKAPKKAAKKDAKKSEKKGRDLPIAKTTEEPPAEPAKPEDVLIAEDEEKKPQTGQKHKRADFRSNSKLAQLPPMFANLDAEYTRSIRGGSGGGRRRRPKGGNRGGRGRSRNRRQTSSQTPRERDPNAVSQIQPGMTVRELSVALGIKLNKIMSYLLGNGQFANVNDILAEEMMEMIANEFEIKFEWRGQATLEDELESELAQDEESVLDEDRVTRPPVITFMGHVDHGKTSLLDKIRETRVTEGESGGITQHIGAYSIVKDDHPITFLDTPGHEAFTAMRARGAKLTDIAVLIVAADDGVMPQTEEACSHARNAGVPIVVAINKCDIPNANPDRVRQELSTRLELLPEEWGGSVGMINVSAMTGEGIEELLERILLEAEMLELSSSPDRKAVGHIVEAKMSENRGVEATILVKDGTLHRGDVVLCSTGYGKVKHMFDGAGHTIDSVGPGFAASITGLSSVPEAGESIYVLDDVIKARAIADQREKEARAAALSRRRHVTLDNLQSYLSEQETADLNVIIKADVQGSLEVLQKTLTDLSNDEVRINIIHSGVGGINQADVILADASDAVVVGFHVIADQSARLQASVHSVQIKVYHVIYRLIEDMKAALTGMLPPEEKEVIHGHVEIRQVFRASRLGNIAGCFVTDGVIPRNANVRVIRDNVVVYDGKIDTLRRVKDDVREVRSGFECGIKISGYNDIKEGDNLEAYTIEEVARTLD